jgi:hypothetical protein
LIGFDILYSVILFNQIIQVFALPDGNHPFRRCTDIEYGPCCRAGTTFINIHHLRLAVMTNGVAKEAQRRCSIPFGGQIV